MIEMNTWKLIELPKGRKPVSCKWVLRVKHKSDGTVEKFKGRLVARGFSQQPGIDYSETDRDKEYFENRTSPTRGTSKVSAGTKQELAKGSA